MTVFHCLKKDVGRLERKRSEERVNKKDFFWLLMNENVTPVAARQGMNRETFSM